MLGFNMETREVVFLKDYWSVDVDGMEKEGKIYALLESKSVPNIAPFGKGNDVGNHTTITHTLRNEHWACWSREMVLLRQYRMSLDVVALVFNYRWGLSRCWAIRPLYGCKQRHNGLRSTICKYGSDHVSDSTHQIFVVYCVLLLCRAMTTDSDDEDSDSGNSDYQFSTPKGLHLASTSR